VSSSRTRQVACLSSALLLAACGSLRGPKGPSLGTALAAVGPQSVSTLTFGTPRAGSTYFVGFPEFTNRSGTPVTVTGFGLGSTSRNVVVLGYDMHSTEQFGGRLLFAYDPTNPERSFDFESARSLTTPYVIGVRAQSHRFAMAKVRITSYPPPAHINGCVVFYMLGSSARRYVQKFDCDFQVGKDVPTLGNRPSTVVIVNSYPHNITVLGCPVCKARGAVLPGDPSAKDGHGGQFGWAVTDSDPLSALVVVGGRRVLCQPPTSSLPTLTYNITRAGRCVVLDS
jgi:hypothetical protein